MLVNPYIAGNPVGGSEAFVGRADILRTVLRVLKNPGENAIVLYGQRRIGKTSVLLELMRRLPQEGPYQPIYFDLQDKAALPLNTVLRELMQRIISATSTSLPLISNNDLPEQFQTIFLTAVLRQLSAGASLVLLFDEFDVLDNPGEGQAGAAFFPYLRNLLTLDPRLQFAFVIGRRPEDLSSLTLSIFKSVKAEHISLLTVNDTTSLISLSAQNDSLRWQKNAIKKVYSLTGGHPFLTQYLCQEIWEATHLDGSDEIPTVTPTIVDSAIEPTLRSANNALEWLWDGLRPAQRIVAAALAEAGAGNISQEQLERHLQQSGVRILIGELQDAPRTLQDWDLLKSGSTGYRFCVELLRRWIVQNKPLRRTQEELDFVQPAAENLFQGAYAFYQKGQLDQAQALLQQVMALNPNHVRGALVLSEILLAQKEITNAKQLLESLYQYHPAAARSRLVQVLLIQADVVTDDEERLVLYKQVLHLEPQQHEARERRRHIWLSQVRALEKAERYEEALILAQTVASELPPDHDQQPDLALLEGKRHLNSLYQEGLTALEAGGRTAAIHLLTKVISLEPTYRQATRYLHLAVTGIDSQKPGSATLEDKRHLDSLYQEGLTALEAGGRTAAIHLLTKVISLEPTYRQATHYLHLAVTGIDSQQLEIDLDQVRQQNQLQEATLETIKRETASKLKNLEAKHLSIVTMLEEERTIHRKLKVAHHNTETALENERTLLRQHEKEVKRLQKRLNPHRQKPLGRFIDRLPVWLIGISLILNFVLLIYVLSTI